MNQMPLYVKLFVFANNNHLPENKKGLERLNTSSRRMQVSQQKPVAGMLLTLVFFVFLLLPGHVVAASNNNAIASQLQNYLVVTLRGTSFHSSLHNLLTVKSIARDQYTGITNIPVIIDSSNREEI